MSANGNLNGKTNVDLQILYTYTQPWIKNNYIVMTIPKANGIYNTGASTNVVAPYISLSNINSA